MGYSLFGNTPYKMSRQQKKTILTCLFILFSIWGYFKIRPYIGFVPAQPEIIEIEFKYGVGSKNILDTTKGTFTKDMIADPPITIELSLTEQELETIWEYLHRNHFYDLPELIPSSVNYGVIPHETYRLIVKAEGYPDKKVIMSDLLQGQYSLQERRFLRIVLKVRGFIENKPEYKSLPEPTGGYY